MAEGKEGKERSENLKQVLDRHVGEVYAIVEAAESDMIVSGLYYDGR